jgi:benzylsuccinate CoA-transferase BbsE subunit
MGASFMVRPFSGIRVLDSSFWLGRYATRLFADLGAEVVRIEPPGGLPDRVSLGRASEHAQAEHVFFNANKQSLVVDTSDEAGLSAYLEMAQEASVIFLEAGASPFEHLARIRDEAKRAVIVVVSPYGLNGPLSDKPANDLTLQAAGGIAWMSGRADDAPLRLPVDQSVMIASVYAAVTAAVSLLDSEATGRGHLIDVSAQECIAHSLQNAIQVWDLEQRISRRGGEGTRDASEDIFRCKDGCIFLASPPTLGVSWKSLVQWMGEINHPSYEEFSKARWLDRNWRTTEEARSLFRATFEAFTMGFSSAELSRESIARKIVMSSVSRVSDLVNDEQLSFREFFTSMDLGGAGRIRYPGAPYALSEPVWQTAAPAALDEHRSSWVAKHSVGR